MRTSKFTPEQILHALRQAESGTTVVDICRKMGVAEATFYRWKKQYAGLDMSELRELKQLRDENRRLKQAAPPTARAVGDERLRVRVRPARAKSRRRSGHNAAKGHPK